MDCTVLFFVVLSASFCENERLSDCSILHLPCISSCIALLLAHKKRVLPDCQLSDCTVVLLSAPMIFQSYNQIMFVNYMPFLCMALWGVDSFLEKENRFSIYPVYFDDHDQLLLQYRRNSGPDFIRTAPILYAAGFAWKENPVS